MPLFTIYLACFTVGTILVLVSILADRYRRARKKKLTEVEDAAASGLRSPANLGAISQRMSSARKILNFHNLIFFTAFFGMAGAFLTLLEIPRIATLIAAHGMGFFGSRVIGKLFRSS